MTKKALLIAMAILFTLPVLCLAGEFEIGDVEMKWWGELPHMRTLLIRVPVTSKVDVDCHIRGKLCLYDKDGFKIYESLFWGDVGPRQSQTLHARNWIAKKYYDETVTVKLELEISSFAWTVERKPPLKIEKSFTLPPWE